MAEKNGATETDIFQQNREMIKTLTDVLERQGSQPGQVVYAAPQEQKPAPNYVLYAALVVIGYLLLRKK